MYTVPRYCDLDGVIEISPLLEGVALMALDACDTIHVPDRYAGVAIVDTADRIGCDLIVMGSHGRRGIDRVLLGSQAYEVVSHCKVPTLIVR